jgi:hypothetical protein
MKIKSAFDFYLSTAAISEPSLFQTLAFGQQLAPPIHFTKLFPPEYLA